MSKDKITGSDIFGGDLKGAYEKFVQYNRIASLSVYDLKKEVIQLNNAFKQRAGISVQMNKVANASKKYSTNLNKATIASNKLTKANNNLAVSQKKTTAGFAGVKNGISSLLGAAGFAGLSVMLVNVIRSLYDTTKALDSISLALTKVTEDTYQFARAQEFLLGISDRLGLNFVKTTKRYTTFLAAARNSNLTMKKTNEIFETFADIGANLALTSDEMGSIFLALEQMLSKGKVSTEELRRQLGEKLPGAMGIMARALKVTTGELDKMLRKGEVLSETALPKFAEEAAKTFSVDLTQRVNTLAAAQERLSNAWILLVDNITEEGGAVKSSFQGVLAVLEGFLNTLTAISNINLETTLKVLKALGGGLVGSGGPGIFKALSEIWKAEDTRVLEKAGVAQDLAYRKWEALYKKYQRITGSGADYEVMVLMGTASKEVLDKRIDEYEEYFNKLGKLQDGAGEKALRKRATAITGPSAISETEVRTVKESYENAFKQLVALEVAYGNETDALLKDRLGVRLSEAQDFFAKMVELMKINGVNIDRTGNELNQPQHTGGGPTTPKDTTARQEAFDTANKYLSASADIYKEIAALENAQFERRMMQLEEEQNAINEKYAQKMKLAGDDSDLQDKLRIQQADEEAKLAKKRQKLEYEQAKAKKKQDTIQAIINTAVAVTAQLTLPVIGWGLAAAAVVAGALQVATIQSQPLPKYAKGTDNHPGGFAMLGDGGKNELAIGPDGGVYMSGDKPEVVNMDKGTRVIADAQEFINKQIVQAVVDADRKMDELVVNKISDEIKKGFKKAQINIQNNNNVSNNIDFQLWRNQLLN